MNESATCQVCNYSEGFQCYLISATPPAFLPGTLITSPHPCPPPRIYREAACVYLDHSLFDPLLPWKWHKEALRWIKVSLAKPCILYCCWSVQLPVGFIPVHFKKSFSYQFQTDLRTADAELPGLNVAEWGTYPTDEFTNFYYSTFGSNVGALQALYVRLFLPWPFLCCKRFRKFAGYKINC